MKIKIHVTKEVLEESMYCPLLWVVDSLGVEEIKSNCAVAVAIRDIFPIAKVYQTEMKVGGKVIKFDDITAKYIAKFDCVKKYEDRLQLPEYSFEINVPDSIITQIGIDQVHAILKESKTLSLA